MRRDRPRTGGPLGAAFGLDADGVRPTDVLDYARGRFREVATGDDEARGRGCGGVELGIEGHERTGVVGERMWVRSRQRADRGWIVPTAWAVSPTA